MQVTFNKRTFTVTKTEPIEGRLAADLIRRGFEAAFFTLTGKRGSTKICFRSINTREFVQAY